MNKLSEHFDSSEFTCKCGCGRMNVNQVLIAKLEQLFYNMNAKAIYINSGCRCPEHSVSVGGFPNDMHVLGGAADIRVVSEDGTLYTSKAICREAEKIGFNGIAIIDDDSAHVDIRGIIPYANDHWFGNESNNKIYNTFANMGEPIKGKTATEKEIKAIIEIEGHKYSGLLTEE